MSKGFVTTALTQLEQLPVQGSVFDLSLARTICELGAGRYPNSPLVRLMYDLRALGLSSELTNYCHRLVKLMLFRRGTAAGQLPFQHLYKQFEIPKKSGQSRRISAPLGNLRNIQQIIKSPLEIGLEKIYAMWDLECVHGFRPKHSNVTAALPHHGQKLVLRLDITNFFDSTKVGTVKRVLNMLLNQVGLENRGSLTSTFLAYLLTCDACLPTGSPTSPIISNGALLHLDGKLAFYASQWGVVYTRYADDLTFSGSYNVQRMVGLAISELRKLGYEVNHEKTNLMRRGRAQVVFGLVVNDGLSVGRDYRRKLRAARHYFEEGRQPHLNGTEIDAKKLEGHLGYLKHVKSLDPGIRNSSLHRD